MHPTMARTLGFLIPTTLVVVGQHLAREATAAEAFDGLFSALFFTAIFGVAALAAHAIRSRRGECVRESISREVQAGALFSVAAWALLWAFWAVPPARQLREMVVIVFPFNCMWILAVGLLAKARPIRATLAHA